MNLQRREEIRELIAEIASVHIEGMSTAIEIRVIDAMRELLAHIDTLEQTAAERVIADGSRGPTPDYTGEGSARVPPKCEPIPTSGQREKDIWNDGFAHGWRAGFDDDGRQMMSVPAVVVPEPTEDDIQGMAEEWPGLEREDPQHYFNIYKRGCEDGAKFVREHSRAIPADQGGADHD